MKTKKNLVKLMFMSILTAGMMTLTACSSEDDVFTEAQNASQVMNNPVARSERTVLIYMAGRNNLSLFATSDLDEIKRGSKLIGSNQTLLVFMRRNYDGGQPWLARVENGELTGKVTIADMGIKKDELYASDPEVMEKVLHYAYSHYPSVKNDYGLVLWGHGSGWLIQDSVSVKSTRGYGVDVGNYIYNPDGKWINIPTMNQVISRMPHLKFIFADCCNFMCLETLYEMRNVADYIIGSPAEVPATGAPYEEVVPALFEPTTFYRSIIDRYHEHEGGHLPLSVVKTSEMEHVAQATRDVLKSISKRQGDTWPDMKGMIHYNYLKNTQEFHQPYNIFYDAGNFLLGYATSEEYQQWKQTLDAAVIEKRYADSWATIKPWDAFYTDFTMTKEKYHGVSLFVPQDPTVEYGECYASLNKHIQQLQWFYVVNQ